MLLRLFALLLVFYTCLGVKRLFPTGEAKRLASANTLFNYSFGYYVYESYFDSNCVDSSLYVAYGQQLGVCTSSLDSSYMYVSGSESESGNNLRDIYVLSYNTVDCTGAYTAYFWIEADGSCVTYGFGGSKVHISDKSDDYVNYPYAGGVRFLYENGGGDDVACDVGNSYYWVYNLCNYCELASAPYCECNSDFISFYAFNSSSCSTNSISEIKTLPANKCIEDIESDDDYDNNIALSSYQCTSMYGKPYFGPFLPLVPSPYPTNMPSSASKTVKPTQFPSVGSGTHAPSTRAVTSAPSASEGKRSSLTIYTSSSCADDSQVLGVNALLVNECVQSNDHSGMNVYVESNGVVSVYYRRYNDMKCAGSYSDVFVVNGPSKCTMDYTTGLFKYAKLVESFPV